MLMRATLRLVALASTAAALIATACGGTAATLALHDAPTLRAERAEWRGDKDGVVYLRRYVRAIVDTAVDPSQADSRLVIHQTLTRFGPPRAVETVRVLAPAGATLDAIRARLIDGAAATPVAPTAKRLTADAPTLDPGQRTWELDFPALSGDQILEVACALTLRGTLATDARWLAAPDGPTGELLLRYDLASDAVAAFEVVGADHEALVAEVDGHPVVALRLTKLPARGDAPDAAWARYVTTRAAPRHYAQPMAGSWAEATAAYLGGLVAPSEGFREGYRVPFVSRAQGRAAVDATYLWARDRLQAPDALTSPWDAGRPLIPHIERNDLTATDKVHLLHWLLDEADIPHALAVARSRRYPATPAALPTPGAFDVALVYVPEHDLWLDPACRTCPPGQVRPELSGGQALALPAGPASAPVELP